MLHLACPSMGNWFLGAMGVGQLPSSFGKPQRLATGGLSSGGPDHVLDSWPRGGAGSDHVS